MTLNNQLYDRKIEVSVGGQTYTYPELEINFDIPKTTSDKVDVAEVNIYNLSDTSINTIMNDSKIIVNAGYGDDLGVIFEGYVEQILPDWQGLSKKVTILASDVGSKFRNKTIKKTYKNSTTKFIITDLAKRLGLKIGQIKPVTNDKHDEYSVDNNIYDEIVSLASKSNSKIYTRDNTLYVLPFDSANDEGVILNYETGLIGSPVREEKEETIKVPAKNQPKPKKKSKRKPKRKMENKTIKVVDYVITSLLNHEIKQDTWIKVESKTLNGKHRVLDVTHTKDFLTVVRIRG